MWSVACLLALAIAAGAGASPTVNVLDYGAKGDGTTKDTAAIAQAFGACEAAGGCTLLFPAPGTYLTGSFNLTSHTTVHVESGATVLASPDAADYPLIPALPSYPNDAANTNPRFAAVVHGPEGVTNVTLTGGGTVDGNGLLWWVQKHLKPTKPPLFQVRGGAFITLTGGVTFQNSPWYTVHPWLTTDFVADGIRIRNPPGAPHTDGIDPDSCTRVTIRNCDITTSDDHISLKSGKGPSASVPTTDVLIADNVFGAGGGIAIGSETSGSIANVLVTGARFTSGSVGNLVRIKSCPTYGGTIVNVTYTNITVAGSVAVGVGVFIDMYYECQTYPLPAPVLTGVLVSDITVPDGDGVVMGESGSIACVSAGGCDVSLAHLTLPSVLGWVNCTNVHGTVTDVTPKPCYS